ncbi:hypothetical protein SAMN04488057_105271 [Cyclobacterium lianum]|uniref:Dolichyl-phosphate-mannose-protein mannosyltransferase n=1 Tax=Cyclobacterium lianum TaxID=388280 RepID=A0A1M7NEY8_9BACT|nr:hypothetical protein [Cyclobacterium lianum]SHN02285.1 hypothetical protein SAMN04488057_105271 [Cyclobacterium lianum]
MQKITPVHLPGIFRKKGAFFFIISGGFAMLFIVSIVSTWIFGPYLSPDTTGFFKITIGYYEPLASLSPFYPFLLANLPLSLIPIFDRVLVLNLLTALLAIYFVYTIASHAEKNKWMVFSLFGISLFSWWSFRVLGSAHADSIFYLQVLVWLHLFVWSEKNEKYYFPSMAVLSAIMVWTKVNSLFLIPLLFIWLIIDRDWRWSIVIVSLIVSWTLYSLVLPENILAFHFSAKENTSTGPLSYLILLYENLAGWMQVTAGLVFSDTLGQSIPRPVAFILGLAWAAFLLAYLVLNKHKRRNKTYLLLLFGATYTFCFLAFQQYSGYREVNYRTLFPYLLVISWSLWITLIRLNNKKLIIVLMVLIVGHTCTGHVLLWMRDDVYSLHIAKKTHHSELKHTIEEVLTNSHREIRTDAPQKLMLSFPDLRVLPVLPTSVFIEGKNYALSNEESLLARDQALNALLEDRAVIVLFAPDEYWQRISERADVAAILTGEGTILYLDTLP